MVEQMHIHFDKHAIFNIDFDKHAIFNIDFENILNKQNIPEDIKSYSLEQYKLFLSASGDALNKGCNGGNYKCDNDNQDDSTNKGCNGANYICKKS